MNTTVQQKTKTVHDLAADQQRLIDRLLAEKYEPIAIVGMALRFPGEVNNPEQMARMLEEGKEAIGPIPRDRWDNSLFYDPVQGKQGKICTDHGGYLKEIDQFDPKFFAISPKEANNIDPQQRIMLELSWEALEQANIDPHQLRGTKGSVHIGISTVDYTRELMSLPNDALVNQMGTGTANSAVSGRISYFLGLRGPCISLDTACSSSLVAVDLAANSLRRGESDIALCGGVNIIHHPSSHVIFSHANMLAPDGRCKTFDESADGYGRSEGAAVFVLKRLSDAVRDADQVLALIRGTAVMQDGESGGLTVPNGTAQEMVMQAALQNAMLTPADISYVEAHGTGTPLGDPIEINAINKVFGDHVSTTEPLVVGSVKTNLGHMEATAGMGGLIKVILQMRAAKIYPHLHFNQPSSHIPWDSLPIKVPTTVLDWKVTKKRAMVNSFGFAGTIASVVLEEPPRLSARSKTKSTMRLLTVSAKSKASLDRQVANFLHSAQELSDEQLDSFCYTSNVGRSHFSHRLAAAPADKQQLLEVLRSNLTRSEQHDTHAGTPKHRKVALMFTGQGSQWRGMGVSLYASIPEFRALVDECAALFQPYLGLSIKDMMFGQTGDDDMRLDQTAYTQPALFTIEYALARLWMGWGIKPSVLIGHSIGEVVAACIAGLFSLEDAVLLVAHRARLMQSVHQQGGMMAVQAGRMLVEPFLTAYPKISFAAVNSPEQSVLSGDKESLATIGEALREAGIGFKSLVVSHAFHSVHMEEMADEFRRCMSTVHFRQPTLTFISNVTGEPANFNDVASIDYWVNHIRQPVEFLRGMTAIEARGQHIFIEVGPQPFLISLGKRCIAAKDHVWLSSLDKSSEGRIEQTLCALYEAGQTIDWQAVHGQHKPTRQPLPLYPFDRKRYWLSGSAVSRSDAASHPLLGRLADQDETSWQFMAEVTPDNPAYLGDHVIMGKIVFPGAGYMEIVLALQDAVFGHTQLSVAQFHIREPLFLSADTPTRLFTRLTDNGGGQYRVEIQSGGADTKQRYTHMNCLLDSENAGQLKERYRAVAWPDRGDHLGSFDWEGLYQRFIDNGLKYGPQFRKVKYLSKLDTATVFGKIESPPSNALEFLNPSVLDAVLHTMAELVPAGQTFLPVGFERFEFFRKPRGRLESMVILRERDPASEFDVLADLMLCDDGQPVFYAQGLGLKAVKAVAGKPENTLLHTTKWNRASLNQDHLKQFSALLVGMQPLVEAADWLRDCSANIAYVETTREVESYLEQHSECNRLVYFWQHRSSGADTGAILANGKANFEAVLALITMIEKIYPTRDLQLMFITSGAQLVAGDDAIMLDIRHVQQSMLWGFCTVLNNEYGRFKAKMVDFDPAPGSTASNYRTLLQELFLGAGQDEYQIAYRNGKRFVNRLHPLHNEGAKNFKLGIREYGSLSEIERQPVDTVAPVGDEIQVQVVAAGVNFKDVLNVLGMLKEYAESVGQVHTALPLGFECAGKVIAVGPAAQFKVGDEVIISQIGCMQKLLTVSSAVAVRKPANISFQQAAGIATAYITSYFALHRLADMKRGDKILIHAAAGGVGQAALQLARRAGAEVFATASMPKQEFIARQGVCHIMNSRNLEFVDTVQMATEQTGVDIVLNSLNKDFIPASLSVLGKQGRFIEIGKIGVWSKAQVSAVRPDVAYHNFDLSEMPQAELNQVNKEILETIIGMIEQEEIGALPVTSFGIDELEEAFGVLSRGQNIGKVVISFDEQDALRNLQPIVVNASDHYLITGGYGALGRRAARWLVTQGARKLALLGRRRPSEEALSAITAELACPELELLALEGDISDPAYLGQTIADLNRRPFRLAGIVHAAGVLADAPISTQSWAQFDKVFAPKVAGTWLLHQECAKYAPLDFFIGYSSVASVIGSVSQANYAAANAFIDALMNWRVAGGLQGLSVNWGPWAEVGMAASLSKSQTQAIEEKGIKYLQADQAMAALGRLGHARVPQALVGEFSWSRYADSLPLVNKLYHKVSKKSARAADRFDLDALIGLPATEREQQVLLKLRTLIGSVLQFDSVDDVEPDARFADLGLDSLVAVELRNVLEKAFKVALPSSITFDHPSVPDLGAHILHALVARQPAQAGGN